MTWLVICMASLVTGSVVGAIIAGALGTASISRWLEAMQYKVCRAEEEARWYRAAADELTKLAEMDHGREAM
jgi:hypothetical protein